MAAVFIGLLRQTSQAEASNMTARQPSHRGVEYTRIFTKSQLYSSQSGTSKFCDRAGALDL